MAEGTVFSHCTFVDCSFARVSLASTVFSECDMKDVDFSGADLSYVDFSRSTMSAPRFVGTRLRQAKFSSVACARADFSGGVDNTTSMRGVQFLNAVLTQLVCRGVDMRESVFSNAQFRNASGTPSPPRFENCDLRGSHFIDTNLVNAIFRGSTLDNAEFPRSRLEGADLGEVRLSESTMAATLSRQLRFLKTRPMIVDDPAPGP
jgi:uncharacterized protein YjbI with pentapeptide repeats